MFFGYCLLSNWWLMLWYYIVRDMVTIINVQQFCYIQLSMCAAASVLVTGYVKH